MLPSLHAMNLAFYVVLALRHRQPQRPEKAFGSSLPSTVIKYIVHYITKLVAGWTAMIERTIFREEHNIFRESVRRFVDREIVPFHAQWEKDGIVPRELWLKAGAEGLLCCTVPAQYGGMGPGFP